MLRTCQLTREHGEEVGTAGGQHATVTRELVVFHADDDVTQHALTTLVIERVQHAQRVRALREVELLRALILLEVKQACDVINKTRINQPIDRSIGRSVDLIKLL